MSNGKATSEGTDSTGVDSSAADCMADSKPAFYERCVSGGAGHGGVTV